MADINRIGQVLINLVSNAIKFTADAKDERKIRVSMGASRQRPPSYPPNVVFFKPSETELELDESARPEWGNGQVAFIMVAIKDTGVGISDQHQKRLSERFNQATPRTDRIYGGFGLGLNISRRLCHMHGGEIGVSSKEGYGSTFGFFFTVRESREALNSADRAEEEFKSDKIWNHTHELGELVSNALGTTISPEIPRSPPATSVQEVAPNAPSDKRKERTAKTVGELEAAQQIPRNDPKNGPNRPMFNLNNRTRPKSPPKVKSKSDPAEGRRILLVEDNIINQQIASRKLRSSGFQVIEASNGLEALDAWRRDKFDCVLMDQEMPVMDGKSATRSIRALEKNSGSSVPIIGVTANVRPEQQAEMLEAGMNSIFHKPYKMRDLCAKVNQMTFATN
jgi:CheY-like chemotaxis protein